jgi:Spy/CpxP family protein refolding chaperone
MKKTLLIALLLSLSAGMAVAQQQGGPGSAPGMQSKGGHFYAGSPVNPAERLTENLGLDEAQAAEVAAIFEEAQLLRDEAHERARQVSDEIRANVHAQIQLLLTPQQQALFEAQLQRHEQLRQALEDMHAEHGFGGGRGTGHCIND